ncbi:MAG TPA: N-acetylmuramoyl-L-alanine amidase-like domain-containing protein [Anaeromyxobacter sp.]
MLATLAAALALAAPAAGPATQIARALVTAPAGGARAAAATRAFVGAPYAPSPLGEGAGRDPDPRFRLDAFDCMTLVETAVALGSASSLAETRVALDDVRYSGAPTYAARNHEVLSQWIPANVAKGFIAEATAALPRGARRAVKEYTPASWDSVRAAGRAIPGLPRARLPLGRFEVGLVSPDEAPAVAARLPEGAIVFVVRTDAPERATRITHAGLVVHGRGGVALVRHATSSRGVSRVIEEPIERFVRREARAFPRWPLDGLAFFEILDATLRVRALSAPGAPRGTQGGPPPAYPAAGL